MVDWIVELDDEGDTKLRPSYPECGLFLYGTKVKCGGDVQPANIHSDCGVMVIRVDGAQEICGAAATLYCNKCGSYACEECMKGNYKGR